MMYVFHARYCFDSVFDRVEVKVFRHIIKKDAQRGPCNSPRRPEKEQSECHPKQRVDCAEIRKTDYERRDDNDEASGEGLQYVPVCTPNVQIRFLSSVQQPQRDDLCNKAPCCGYQHRGGRKVSEILKPHSAHPKYEYSHSKQEHSVNKSAYDLRTDKPKRLKTCSRTCCIAACDKRDQHPSYGRGRM